MRTRPALLTTASVAALGLCVTAGSAGAATASPAKGSAASTLSLLKVTAAGHSLSVADLALTTSTLTGKAVSAVTLTPLTADGTAIGKQTVTPANSPLTTPAASSPGALSSIVSLTSPVLGAEATDAPSAAAGAESLGVLKLLGMDVSLDGALDLGSAVNALQGASSGENIAIEGLALPSIADLLAALGLDLSKLPIGTLNNLVGALDLVNAAVASARTAASAALAQVATATSAVTAATTALADATADVASATSALQTQLDLIPAASLIGLPAGSDTVAGFLALPSATQTLLAAVVPGITAALTTLTTAQGVLATADAALDAAQAALDALIASLQATLAPLLAALTGVLDSTPLLSLDELALTSSALVTSNKEGGQHAEVLGGTITGLKVLGTDVLDTVLGSSSIDLTDLVGTTATQVTSTIDGLTGTLSSVLSTVPGLAGLKIPAPQVDLMTKSATTSISGGFGRATTAVTGLKIALPAVTVPSAVALPGASTLPGLSLVNGLLTSAPISLDLATVGAQSAFAPAVVAPTTPGTPTTGAPTLPTTGLPVGLAAVAVLTLGGALVLRRRVTS